MAKSTHKGKRIAVKAAAFAAFAVVAVAAEPLPKVWMSAQWRDPFAETIRMCAEQGVDVVEVPSWTTNHCAYALAALRKYKVKGFTSGGEDPSEDVHGLAGGDRPYERAVCVAGAYRGQAIDRTLFTFEPKAYDIVIEPPVYSAHQVYTSTKKGPDGKMRMWEQHAPFAPDAMMWLGFDMKPGKTDTEMTFPKGNPDSWAYAKELFAEVHGKAAETAAPHMESRHLGDDHARSVVRLAVLRPYSTRAICCAQGPAWAAWRNPADRILEAYVRAWSVDNGLLYDIFELPPSIEELRKYKYIVSTLPWPGARALGAGTEGTVMTAKEIAALRKKFAAEITELKTKGAIQ